MTRKLFFLLLAFAAVVLVLVGIGMLTAPTEAPAQKIQLSDGTTTTLQAVTYGASNRILLGKSWQKYLYNFLPARFKSWSRARLYVSGISGYSTNTPMFWLLNSKPSGHPNSSFSFGHPIDEYGCELKNSGTGSVGYSVSEHEWLYGYQYEPTPPHGRIIGLVLYDYPAETNRLGTFLIPGNKMPIAAPASAAPLSEKEDGDLKFQLLSFETGLKAGAYPSWYGTNLPSTFSQAAFHIFKNGQVVSNWQPTAIQLTSADGRRFNPRMRVSATRDGQGIYNFEGNCPPEQGPWKLRVEFIHEKDFSPEELVKIPGVTVPAEFGITEVGKEVEFQGTTLRVEQSLGSGISPPTNFWSTTPPPPHLRVTMTPPNSSLHLRLAKATDEYGTNQSANSYPGYFGGKYIFQLRNFTNAQTLNLTFALHRSRFIEFEANSTWYPTNAVTGK